MKVRSLILALALTPVLATASVALDVACFRDASGGYLRVIVPERDLGGTPLEACAPVRPTGDLFALYGIDSRRLSGETRRFHAPASDTPEVKALREEVDRVSKEKMEIWDRQRTLRESRGFAATLLAKARSGEIELPAKAVAETESNLAATDAYLKELEVREAELSERQDGLWKRINETGDRAAHAGLGEAVRYVAVARFRGAGPASFAIADRRSGAKRLDVTIDRSAAPGGDPSVRDDWERTQRIRLEGLAAETPGESAFSYILCQTEARKATGKSERPDVQGAAARPAPDLYSLASGALAIQESLQLDRMTGRRDREATGGAVPLALLAGPAIKGHPFAAMLVGRKPEVEPIARFCPEEFYFLHFSDITQQFAFADLADQWGTSLLQSFQVASRDAGLKEKYLAQLCLESSALARLFGDKAIADLAIVGSDPFLDEGTDLSVIFSLKNAALFDASAKVRREQAKAARPDAKEEALTVRGRPVAALRTADRAIASLTVDVEGYRVYSNSTAALDRVLAAFDGAAPCLAEALDYKYMRTVFPARPAEEDGFLYLSEKHIRALVGPAGKIERRRRFECVNSLRILNNAVTLWRSEGRTGEATLAALVDAGCLEARYLDCPDGGTYAFDPVTGAPVCAVHGRLRTLAPVLERTPATATAEEAESYKKFVEDYNRYWTGYFDPVGVRLTQTGGNVALSTCILPLVDNSAYDGLKNYSGGEPVTMAHPIAPGTILSILVKQDLVKRADEWRVEGMLGATNFTLEQLFAAFGDSAGFHFADGPLRFTVDLGDRFVTNEILRNSWYGIVGAFTLGSLSLPAYVTIPARDEGLAERFIDQLFRAAAVQAAAQGGGFLRTFAESYGTETAPGGKTIRTLTVTLAVLKLRLYALVDRGFLILATDRKILLDLLAQTTPAPVVTGNLALIIRFANFRQVSETLRIDGAERMRAACLANLGSVWVLGRMRGVPPEKFAVESLAVNGHVPFCPANGTYAVDLDRGCARCSVHGDLEGQRQPLAPDPALPLQRFLDGLREVAVTLAFTPEGILTRVTMDRNGD